MFTKKVASDSILFMFLYVCTTYRKQRLGFRESSESGFQINAHSRFRFTRIQDHGLNNGKLRQCLDHGLI